MSAAGPRYRISRRLGQGGMAEVFEAEVVGELGFSRKVAIKRMLGDAAADPASAQRFLDEARIASRLHHANIVAVTDVGLLDSLPFHVLEYVDGLTAQQLQQRAGGVLPLEVALIITADVAHGLDHAHRAVDSDGVPLGVVHRDVKPSNVLVSWGGDVKLADFGIALARDRETRTETGIVAGTLGYIAPEQRTRSDVDGRADVFALGLTLHAMLTGYTPLRDISVEMDLLAGTPVPLDAALPAEVRAVIARAVLPWRLDRPSAGEFADAIGALLAPRLSRDARTYMRGFLDSLDAKKPAAGALDQLLGIDIVPAASPAGDVPQYKTVVARPIAEATTKAVGVVPPPAIAPRRRGVVVAGLVLALLAAVGVGAWQIASTSTTPATAADAATTVIAQTADAASEAVVDVDAEVVMVDAATAVTPRHKPDKPPDKPPDASVAIAPTTTETGWLQVVGGEELVGAQVIVDGGKWKFSVPNPHEVTVGNHTVVVIKPDGTKLPAKTVEVTTFHTSGKKAARVAY